MYHIYIMVNRLYRGLNKSIDDISIATAKKGLYPIDRSTLYNILNDPTKNVQVATRHSIRSVYFEFVQEYIKLGSLDSIFLVRYPPIINNFFDLYKINRKGLKKKYLKQSSKLLQEILIKGSEDSNEFGIDSDVDDLFRLRCNWLLAKIEKDIAYDGIRNPINPSDYGYGVSSQLERAKNYYSLALELLSKRRNFYPNQYISLKLNLLNCELALVVNANKSASNNLGEEFNQTVLNKNDIWSQYSELIPMLEISLEREYYQWKHARFGLLICSLIRDKERFCNFLSLLKNSHSRFNDPTFSPGWHFFQSPTECPFIKAFVAQSEFLNMYKKIKVAEKPKNGFLIKKK